MSLAVVHDPRLRHGAAGTRCQIALRVMHQETVAKRARDKMLSDDLAAPLRHLLPHVAIPVLRCRRIEFADHVTKLFCRRDDVTRHRSTLDLIAVESPAARAAVEDLGDFPAQVPRVAQSLVQALAHDWRRLVSRIPPTNEDRKGGV